MVQDYLLVRSYYTRLRIVFLRRRRRHITGGCYRKPNGMIHIFVVMQCLQALFISSCCAYCLDHQLSPCSDLCNISVIYAVWKSSGIPAARSRISLQLSMDDLHEVSDDYLGGSQGGDDDSNHIRRGWWDYVPSSEKPPSSAQGRRFGFPSVRGIIRNLWIFIRRPWMRSENSPDVVLARKCSIPGDVPLPQPARPSAVRISGNDHRENHRPRSPMPSLSIYRSGLIPRMVLCQEVMRNEVCSTR